MLTIIDYGIGNLTSVKNMLKKVGCRDIKISGLKEDIINADKLILPGVGHFDHCMELFEKSGLRTIIEDQVFTHKVPTLCICVGLQMLFDNSEEGNQKGLGWIPGQVIKFKAEKLPMEYKIPHMAWTDLKVKDASNALFQNITDPRFYFVHSYHADCDDQYISSTANYGYDFAASVVRENIQGVQFHPEKSHKFGLQLFKNFSEDPHEKN